MLVPICFGMENIPLRYFFHSTMYAILQLMTVLILSFALKGYGTNRIGKVLYERKIPKPSYYKQEFFSQHDTGDDDYWYDWKQEVITRLLRNPVYKGGMYVHEAVVTKEVWQTVQDIIDRHAVKAMKDKEKFICRCHQCGAVYGEPCTVRRHEETHSNGKL